MANADLRTRAERYTPLKTVNGTVTMLHHPEGEWVRHEDHVAALAAAEQREQALREQLAEAKASAEHYADALSREQP